MRVSGLTRSGRIVILTRALWHLPDSWDALTAVSNLGPHVTQPFAYRRRVLGAGLHERGRA